MLARTQSGHVAEALAGAVDADAVREEAVYTDGLGTRAQLDPAAARKQVAAYLGQVGASGRYTGLRWTVRAHEDSVEVRVTTPLNLPFAPPGWAERTDVTGTAVAIVVVGD